MAAALNALIVTTATLILLCGAQEEALVEEKVGSGLFIALPKDLSEAEIKEFGQTLAQNNPGFIVKSQTWNEKRGYFAYFTGASSYTIKVGGDVIDVIPDKTIHIAPESGVERLRRLAGEGHFKRATATKLKQQKEAYTNNNIINSLPSPRCRMGAATSKPSPGSHKSDRKLLENENLGKVKIRPPHADFSSPSCSHPVQALSEENLKKDEPEAYISTKVNLKFFVDKVNPVGSPSSCMRETILEGRQRLQDVVVKPDIQILLPSLDASSSVWLAVEKHLGIDISQMIWKAFQFFPWFFIVYDYSVFLRRVWRSPAWMPTIYIRLGCPPQYVVFVFWGAYFDHQNFGRTAFYQRLLFGYIMHMLAAEGPAAAADEIGRQARSRR